MDYYQTLRVSPSASQAEIKQAYRTLAKQFHPDSQGSQGDHEQIVQINAAYEILGDVQHRQAYDRQRQDPETPADCLSWSRTVTPEEALTQWLQEVYTPVNRLLTQTLNSLQAEINDLAADPFDDALMEDFQAYLEDCRDRQERAQKIFSAHPNPPKAASFAANLYYYLNQVADGLDELERFTTCYDESYLHTGQEMFRIANRLKQEAQVAYRQFK
jgi:molecular chaperone DnaJ